MSVYMADSSHPGRGAEVGPRGRRRWKCVGSFEACRSANAAGGSCAAANLLARGGGRFSRSAGATGDGGRSKRSGLLGRPGTYQ